MFQANKYFLCLGLLVFLAGCSAEQNTAKAEPETEKMTEGALLVKQNCRVCHAQGINGAPIIGNKKMWQSRLGQGTETLVNHAINGYGLMPPKGGKTALTDEQIAIAVDYMVEQAR